MEDSILLKICDIKKSFPGVKALDKVSFEVKKGEVHALVGENGAGKSTLMNILVGNYKKDEGSICFKGSEIEIKDHHHANSMGISIVYQERSLVSKLNIAENIFAGRQPVKMFGNIDRRELYKRTKVLLDELEIDEDPNIVVASLPPAKQQMIEIAKALSIKPELLILDEPTATITDKETKILFNIIKNLINQEVSIIYISHVLSEVFKIAGRVSVLKDGKYMGTKIVKESTINDIIKLMVGRELGDIEVVKNYKDDKVLEVKNLCSKKFNNISFYLKKGEILTLAGLAGAGRTEVVRAIFGIDKRLKGDIYISGKKIDIKNPGMAIKAGLGFLPEDRKEQGLFLIMSIAANIGIGDLKRFSSSLYINDKEIEKYAEFFKEKLDIIAPDIKQEILNLSGGNQQKVVLSRWLLVDQKILIMDEPTRGIDVGAKAEIYKIINEITSKGTSVLVVSSDMKEVLSISNRIIIMYQGNITGELNSEDATEEKILQLASGMI